jgi:APA family basic amino acid/polyamine antiporter
MPSSATPIRLKLATAISLVIGCAIGSGVFVKPGIVLTAAGSSNGALLAWVLAGVMSLAGGLTVAEIAMRLPETGGVYVYIEELYGKKFGFVCGWVQTLIYGPGLMSALALYFGSLFAQFFSFAPTEQKSIAFISLFILAALNVVSMRGAALLQNVTTVLKLLPILAIGVAGLSLGSEQIFGVTLPNAHHAVGMGAAILAALWAYDGWMQVANIAGEIEKPEKNLPRAIVIGLTTVMAAYVLVNSALFHLLDKELIASLNERATAVAAEQVFGTTGGRLLSLGILVSIFGCLNGNIMTLVRVPYAIALRGTFPFRQVFSRLHPKFQTPQNSIILNSALASIMIAFLNPDRITDLALFSMYLFYGLVFVGIFKVRKKFGLPKAGEYRVPLYPVVPLVAIAGCIAICVGMITQSPMDAAVSIAIALLGFPVYFWLSRRQAS